MKIFRNKIKQVILYLLDEVNFEHKVQKNEECSSEHCFLQWSYLTFQAFLGSPVQPPHSCFRWVED